MRDTLSVAVLQSCKYLLKDPFSIILVKLPMGLLSQIAMQATSTDILHDQVDIVISFEGLIDLHNVGVVHLLEKLDLSPDTSLPVGISQLGLIIHFDRKLLAISLSRCNSHNGVGSLADLLTKDKFVQFYIPITL